MRIEGELTSGSLQPKHRQLAQLLWEQVKSANPGQPIPSEHELCRQFGISRVTVRKAMATLVKDGLLVRRPGLGTFVVDPDAESSLGPAVRPARHPTIALIAANTLGSFVSLIIQGAEQVIHDHGYDILVRISDDNVERERQAIERALDRRVAGVMLMATAEHSPVNPNCYHYLRIVEAGIPLLFLDRYIPNLPVGYVTAANFEGMGLLTRHLVAQGHRSIAYVTKPAMVTSLQERREGYLAAMLERGLQPQFMTTKSRHAGGSDIDAGYEAGVALLGGGGPRPRALLACNSYVAIGLQRAVREAGLAVPDDIALAGFEDVPEAAVVEVPLTVIRAPVESMGSIAAAKLIEHVEQGKGTCNDVRLKIPGELVVRQSCGAASSTMAAS